MSDLRIFTIGHSTLPIEEFARLLHSHGVSTLVDVRSYPSSRYCPQFGQASMSESLGSSNLRYVHLPLLGGRRGKQPVDQQVNSGWTHKAFKNYADYTLTDTYTQGIDQLLDLSGSIAMCCSESVPWKCHRLIVSNTLTAIGYEINHIMSDGSLRTHRLDEWGAKSKLTECGCLTYPKNGGKP